MLKISTHSLVRWAGLSERLRRTRSSQAPGIGASGASSRPIRHSCSIPVPGWTDVGTGDMSMPLPGSGTRSWTPGAINVSAIPANALSPGG
jgi:hypothetical protein